MSDEKFLFLVEPLKQKYYSINKGLAEANPLLISVFEIGKVCNLIGRIESRYRCGRINLRF